METIGGNERMVVSVEWRSRYNDGRVDTMMLELGHVYVHCNILFERYELCRTFWVISTSLRV